MRGRAAFLSLLLLFAGSCYFFTPTVTCAALSKSFTSEVSAATSHRFSADLDGGGDVSVSQFSLAAGVAIPSDTKWKLNLNAHYGLEAYDFSNPDLPAPWKTINQAGIGARLSYKLTDDWTIGISPAVQYAGEDGAEFDHALIYGGFFSATYLKSPDLILGLGAGVFYRLEETRVIPIIFFSWKISDKLRLGNASRQGSANPAGLELTYYFDQNWEIGIGGAYRSSRFRIAEDGPVPGGVGQDSGWPVYAHVRYNVGKRLHLDLTGGWILGEKIRIEDRNGNEIRSIGYETAPMLGLNIGASF
ncbi:MAG: hypothetical protein JXA41_08400 [Deltaproteobacteria bacterium]|nr:hypothetical protein [Deltaproteobacteria bacterium]